MPSPLLPVTLQRYYDNVLMVAFVQREHWNECVNFLMILRKNGLLPTLAIALDEPSVDLLQKQG